MAIEFTRDQNLFVAEKSGVIKYFESVDDTSPEVVTNMQDAVYGFWDRGLMDIALDPHFPDAPYLYVLYTYDAPFGQQAPWYYDTDNRNPQSPSTAPAGAVTGKLSRLTLARTETGWKATEEKVLIQDWCQVFPSHSVGGLEFGPDGALYVSGGDGASFESMDQGQFENFCGDPQGEGGALRSQDLLTWADPVTLSGTIIRIDPETGRAMPDNPLVGAPGAEDGRDRIVAYGLRNPFRFTFKPKSNELWIGDVGWGSWEEVNQMGDSKQLTNFGWPCYEGNQRQPEYAQTALCQSLYASESSTDKAARVQVTAPHFAYPHLTSNYPNNPCGDGQSASISGLAFYQGSSYSKEYQGALFMADYARNCIWVEYADGFQESLFPEAKAPVDLKAGPGGDIYYVAITEGTIHRIAPVASDSPGDPEDPAKKPVPVIALPQEGQQAAAGEEVQFSGSATDPQGNPLPASALKWGIVARHCEGTSCHDHYLQEFEGITSGKFIMPGDHDRPSYVEVRLKATYVENGVSYSQQVSRRVDFKTP